MDTTDRRTILTEPSDLPKKYKELVILEAQERMEMIFTGDTLRDNLKR